KFFYLLLPLVFERRRTDDQRSSKPKKLFFHNRGSNSLNSLTQTHLIGNNRSFPESSKLHTFLLVWKQRYLKRRKVKLRIFFYRLQHFLIPRLSNFFLHLRPYQYV